MTASPHSPRLAWIALSLVIIALVTLLILFGPQLWQFFHDPQKLRSWILSWGVWAPLIFIGLQILQVVVFVIPGEVTQIAGGYLFGFWDGVSFSLLGIAIGSLMSFFLARALGVGFVHAIAGQDNVQKFDRLMASPQLVGSFFLLFLIPGIPKDILCYVAGLSRLRWSAFLLISTIARLPGILSSSLMGKALATNQWGLLVGIGVAAVLLFGLGWFYRGPILRWIDRFAIEKPNQTEAP